MKILLLSAADLHGGAAKVALGLGRGLRRNGHEVDMLVSRKNSNEPWIREIETKEPYFKSVSGRLIHRAGINELSLNSRLPFHLKGEYLDTYDLIHLHDLPKDFNMFSLPWLSRKKPVAWTLHTMWPFTGGCLFSYGCEKWKRHCGACPQFGTWPLHWLHRDGSRLNHSLKKTAYGISGLNLITVSHWLEEQARQSIVKEQKITTIGNFADPDSFFPESKGECRLALGIPEKANVILFAVSGNLQDRRKGVDIMLQALERLKGKDLFLIPTAISPVGQDLQELLSRFPGLPAKNIHDDHELRKHYAAADIVWHPTRADTSSMVSLESMACGTPVIAASVGGVPEVVGKGGMLIEPESPEALARATMEFFNSESMRAALPKKALLQQAEHNSYDSFLEKHINLYERMLEERYS